MQRLLLGLAIGFLGCITLPANLAAQGPPVYDKAGVAPNQAPGLDPSHATLYRTLAWLQATCADEKLRDGKKAFENASTAFQLTGGKDWKCVETLAAAYAECGDFANATRWQTKAVEMAPDEGNRQWCRSLLELYKRHKPYHQAPKKMSATDDNNRGRPPEAQVGDIVVTLDNCVLQDGPTATNLPKGVPLRVIEIRADWVYCSVLVNGKEERGWIQKKWLVVTANIAIPANLNSQDAAEKGVYDAVGDYGQLFSIDLYGVGSYGDRGTASNAKGYGMDMRREHDDPRYEQRTHSDPSREQRTYSDPPHESHAHTDPPHEQHERDDQREKDHKAKDQ